MRTRIERERAFHDVAFTEATRRGVWGYYSITAASRAAFRTALISEGLDGRRVLEYGSGADAHGLFAAAHGADVHCIDVSPVAIAAGQRRAAADESAGRIAFSVMDAEALEFDDASFDVVCGSGVVHHLDLGRAYPEMARVLRPGGAALFVEPLGHNPVINAYRRRTPQLRTADEHPLRTADLRAARRHFATVQARPFHLTALAAVPLREGRAFGPVLAALERVDHAVFATVPRLRKHAWMVLLRLAGPRTPSARGHVAVTR